MAKLTIKPLPSLGRLDYYKTGILSKSGLWEFKAKLEGQKLMKAKPETLRFGQLFHEAIYEPALFVSTDEYIRARVTANPKNSDVKLIYHVCRMAEAAKKDLILAQFLKDKNSKFEQPVWALINDVPIQIKMDCFNGRYIHDAKSTACNTFDSFLQTCVEYGYFEQAALYKMVSGAKNMYFLGVSKSEPHKTFPVDCSKFKKEMKEATENILFLIETYCKLNKKYVENSLKNWKP